MIKKLLLGSVGAALCAAGATAPAAQAAQLPAVIAVAFTFQLPETTIAQGSGLTFVNADPAAHDVTANETGSNGLPLFTSGTITTGSAPVAGVEALEPGTYAFYCTVHESMRGLLSVE